MYVRIERKNRNAGVCHNGRSTLTVTKEERDQALDRVGELSSKTDSLEEQVAKLCRLLQESQHRTAEKAKQVQDAEVIIVRSPDRST